MLLRSISDAAPDSKKKAKRLEGKGVLNASCLSVDGIVEVEVNEDRKVMLMLTDSKKTKKRVKRLGINEDRKVPPTACAYINWLERALKEAKERRAGKRDEDEEMASACVYHHQLHQSLEEVNEWIAEEEKKNGWAKSRLGRKWVIKVNIKVAAVGEEERRAAEEDVAGTVCVDGDVLPKGAAPVHGSADCKE